MTASRPLLPLALLVTLAACEMRKAETPPAATDTTTAVAPATTDTASGAGSRPDSLVRDSVVRDSLAAASAAAGRTEDKRPATGAAKAQAPYLGRDSAFGPSFTLDSTGKAIPIGKKKP